MNAPMKIVPADHSESPVIKLGEGNRLLRLPDVMAFSGLGKTMIYRKVKEGTFPAPFKPGGAASRWSERELAEWKAEIQEQRDAA